MIAKRSNRILDWLVRDWQWPAATLFAACFLLLLAPLLWRANVGLDLILVYLLLPAYMLHQWEEHAGDRFRKCVNERMAGGREALTPLATFWINSLGVWGVDLLAIYLAAFVRPSLGLIAVYLAVINGLAHLGQALARREYNPGLGTAVGLFLPLGAGTWLALNSSGADWRDHAIGSAVALGVHVAILVHVALRVRRLSASATANGPIACSVGALSCLD